MTRSVGSKVLARDPSIRLFDGQIFHWKCRINQSNRCNILQIVVERVLWTQTSSDCWTHGNNKKWCFKVKFWTDWCGQLTGLSKFLPKILLGRIVECQNVNTFCVTNSVSYSQLQLSRASLMIWLQMISSTAFSVKFSITLILTQLTGFFAQEVYRFSWWLDI